MKTMKNSVKTRFRAYQLGAAGSSFSYCAGGHFTLIEARLTEVNRRSLIDEMQICEVSSIDTLHITSWDTDHCAPSEIDDLLSLVRPVRIELPGYPPHTKAAESCKRSIELYQAGSNRPTEVVCISPEYINGLSAAGELGYRDVLYHPKFIDPDCDNNNSTVKFFRKGSFNVLSLGDVESEHLSARLRRDKYLARETDILILAHHGADNGFTNKKFLRRINPKLAICSSNYDNQFDHPKPEIRRLLFDEKIKLFTTKTGDVLIESYGRENDDFRVTNLVKDSGEVSSIGNFRAKKQHFLSMNMDTVKQLFSKSGKYPR